MMDIFDIAKGFASIKFQHIPKILNVVAHSVAKIG